MPRGSDATSCAVPQRSAKWCKLKVLCAGFASVNGRTLGVDRLTMGSCRTTAASSPPGRQPRRPWHETRAVLNGVFWILGTGAQWRELPEKYPPFQTCHRRFQQWVRSGKLEEALTLLARLLYERGKLNLNEAFVDATFASAKKGALPSDVIRTKASRMILRFLVEDQELREQGEAFMKIIGCDFHPGWQQVGIFDDETAEIEEFKLSHGDGEAERFYRKLQAPAPALVGMEATGNSQWFVDLLQRLGHEVWVGNAAEIRASYVRKQKTDKLDAAHILKPLMKRRFPRLWTPSAEQRGLRQMLIHRQKLVEIRTRVKNGLQHLAMNRSLQKKSNLWSVRGRAELERLPLDGWAARRREDLLGLLEHLNRQIGKLDDAVGEAAKRNPQARLLMTQPGVGPITTLAFVLTIGDVSRFQRGKQVASYLGLIPRERSSGGRQRLGGISKQGNSFVRMLLVEAAQATNRLDEGFRKQHAARCHHKPKAVAKVAAARKLAVRLYWMLRSNTPYPEIARIEGSPGWEWSAQARPSV